MTGPLYPKPGNNANLIGKLIKSLKENNHEIVLFSGAFDVKKEPLPSLIFQTPVYWVKDDKSDLRRCVLFPLISRIIDRRGFADAIRVQVLSQGLTELMRHETFDCIISTTEPYSMAVCASKINNAKKILYIFDPPAVLTHVYNPPYRANTLKNTLSKQNIIISTPFILHELKKNRLIREKTTLIEAGFPLIESENRFDGKKNSEVIKLLFTGWLYSNMRSPEYFLNIVTRLDSRFQVVFMGRECDKLRERYSINSAAEIVTLSQQPYETALRAMADADILINIGNNVPVHMPSKTLEYINTGKPIVNFYKFDNCPTLYYTRQYPLALNLFEGDPDIENAARRFIQFCEENKGKKADRDYILCKYKDCTADYITGKIIEALEK